MTTPIKVHAFTDVGLRRSRNEDAVLVGGWLCQTHTGALAAMEFPATSPFVCAVADGMGGHAGGNLASRIALSVIADLAPTWRTPDDVRRALQYVNEQVREVGADPDLQGLGTTVAGLFVEADGIIAFNIGDTRIYTLDNGFLQQLSVDDSVLDQHGRTGSIVTQSMGQPQPVDPHVTELPAQAGAFLICSDGVSGVLSPANLRATVLAPDHAVCASAIIAATRDNGADDNFSFLLVEIPPLEHGALSDTEATVATATADQRGADSSRPAASAPPES